MIADELRAYLSSKIFKKFVPIFNHWAVSNKLNSMARHVVQREMQKLQELKYKKFEVEKIYSLSDVPTKLDASDRLVNADKNSELAQSYIDEVDFAANEEIRNQAKNSIMNKSFNLDLLRNDSFNSLDDHMLKFMNAGVSRTFSNITDFQPFNN